MTSLPAGKKPEGRRFILGGQKHTQAREPHACHVLTRLRSPFDGPKRSLLAAHRVRPSQAPENILISQEPQADVERGRRAALAQPAPRQEQTGTKVRVWKAAFPGPPACPPACQAKCRRLSPCCYMMPASVISVPAGSPITPPPSPGPRRLGHLGRSTGSGVRKL